MTLQFRLLLRVTVLAVLALPACTSSGQRLPSDSPPAATATVTPAVGTFRVTESQAAEIAAVVAFVRAYNAGSLLALLAQLSDQPQLSDCDYIQATTVDLAGRPAIERWLRHRFADHDKVRISEIRDDNPDQPVGVVGVGIARRTSDTLAARGHPDGIAPGVAAKVVFAADGRIQRFAMGPVGGAADTCRLP